MTLGQETLLEQIQALLTAPTSGASAPSLASLEETLTEGYAKAMALEAERWRLERRLSEVARTLEGPDASSVAEELAALAKRLTSAEGELNRLRVLLRPLHERVRSMRLAAQTAQ